MKRAERWKPVPGWPLLASDQGRIKRNDRRVSGVPGVPTRNRVLKIREDGKLQITVEGRLRKKSVAYWVLLAFKGPPPGPYGFGKGFYLSRHLDDDRGNNKLSNLAWGTNKDNYADSIRNGRAFVFTDEHRAKSVATRLKKRRAS